MMSLLDESVSNALLSNRIVGHKQSYLADNPKEGAAVITYLNGGVRPLSVVTKMGLHLVALEDARRQGYAPPIQPGNSSNYSADQYTSGLYNE
jgi:hypothetical protein